MTNGEGNSLFPVKIVLYAGVRVHLWIATMTVQVRQNSQFKPQRKVNLLIQVASSMPMSTARELFVDSMDGMAEEV